jgi:hypothetical protein
MRGEFPIGNPRQSSNHMGESSVMTPSPSHRSLSREISDVTGGIQNGQILAKAPELLRYAYIS